MFTLGLIIILSYLVGSIPTGIIISRAVGKIDIRDHGSGNIGGTNVFRILGWKYGLLVLLLDALKGVIAVLYISKLHYGILPFANSTPFDDYTLVQIIAGMVAVLGHVFTIFAGFKGGKGVATGLGVLIVLTTTDLLIALGIFIILVYLFRYVSLGSMLATISIPVTMTIREFVFDANIEGYYTLLVFLIIIASFIVYTHRSNIVRIVNGSEHKIEFKKAKEK